MRICKFLLAIGLSATLGGCAAANKVDGKRFFDKRLPVSYALPGTSTAVVGIALGKDGLPQETVREIILLPGQKVIFAGPDRFQIVFKEKKSPTRNIREDSNNGVIAVAIPKDILERPEFIEEYNRNDYITFNYSIIVNGKELDPPLIVKRDY